jgi:O-antigen ligase
MVLAGLLWSSRAHKDLSRLKVISLGLVVMLTWCWISISWSVVPGVAMRRLTLTTLIIWMCFLAVDQCGVERTQVIIRKIMVYVLFANFLIVITMPSLGIHNVSEADDPGIVGAWRGVMLSKNFAGAFCAITIIFYLQNATGIPRLRRFLVLALASFFLYKTQSKTSMGIAALSVTLGWLSTFYSPRYRLFIFAAVFFIIGMISIAASFYWKAISAPFYDDAAFTGRTQIWRAMAAFLNDHLLKGAGYGSFWGVGSASPIFAYVKDGSWIEKLVSSGHNGYMDILVQVGLPGLVLAVLTTVILPLFSLLYSLNIGKPLRGLLISMVIFCAGHNFTESSILDRDLIVNVFLMLTIAMTYSATEIGRTRAVPSARASFSTSSG